MKIKRGLLLVKGFIALGIVSGTWLCYTQLMKINSFSCTIDPRLSRASKQRIIDFLDAQAQADIITTACACKKKFPYIDSISVQRCGPFSVHYEINAVNLLTSINRELLVAENGSLFPHATFVPNTRDYVFDIACAQCNKQFVTPEFVQFVKTVSPKILASHAITWKDHHTIEMRRAADPDFSLVCDVEHIPSHTIIEQCDQIYQQVRQKELEKKSRKQHQWVADIRFENQIIMTADKKGVLYG